MGNEAEAVQRITWDDFAGLLQREGYLALGEMIKRVKQHFERAEAESERFRALVQQAEADREELWRMHRAFGDTAVEEAEGEEAQGWVRRGEVMREEADWKRTGRRIPLSVRVGKTWREALEESRAAVSDLRARFEMVENRRLHVIFRLDAAEEVLCNYELYGVVWFWDEPSDTAGARVDNRQGSAVARWLDLLAEELLESEWEGSRATLGVREEWKGGKHTALFEEVAFAQGVDGAAVSKAIKRAVDDGVLEVRGLEWPLGRKGGLDRLAAFLIERAGRQHRGG